MSLLPGYTRESCDRAVYMVQTSPPPQQPQQKEILRFIASCMLGPASPPASR